MIVINGVKIVIDRRYRLEHQRYLLVKSMIVMKGQNFNLNDMIMSNSVDTLVDGIIAINCVNSASHV